MPHPDDWRALYPFDSHWLTIGGHRYHYLDEGQGPTLLLVHGNPTWSFYWREMVLAWRDRYRVVVQVETASQHPLARFDHHGLEAALKYVPGSEVPPVPPDAISHIEPLHRSAQVGLRRAHHQVVMVIQEHVSVHFHRLQLDHLAHQLQEVPPIPFIKKDPLPVVPPGRHMIPAVLEICA